LCFFYFIINKAIKLMAIIIIRLKLV